MPKRVCINVVVYPCHVSQAWMSDVHNRLSLPSSQSTKSVRGVAGKEGAWYQYTSKKEQGSAMRACECLESGFTRRKFFYTVIC